MRPFDQVRPGAGGEEAALFAMDLWGMYQVRLPCECCALHMQ